MGIVFNSVFLWDQTYSVIREYLAFSCWFLIAQKVNMLACEPPCLLCYSEISLITIEFKQFMLCWPTFYQKRLQDLFLGISKGSRGITVCNSDR